MPYDKTSTEKFLRGVQDRRATEVKSTRGFDFLNRGPHPEREAERDPTDEERQFGASPLGGRRK